MYRTFAISLLCVVASVHVAAHDLRSDQQTEHLVRSAGKAARCADKVGANKRKRHALRKRDLLDVHNETTYAIHADAPRYDFLKNDTCILTPEATDGPHWFPQSQTLRQDLTEAQDGVPLELEIGVIDINTCEPLVDVLLDIWHCNATGSYSSFTGRDPNTPFVTLVQNVTDESPSELNTTDWRFLHTDEETWLRGTWPTDDQGVTQFKTIFPGFYVDRSIHIHVQAHTDWSVSSNGTLQHGRTVETGQIFIDESLSAKIMSLEPYATHTEIDRLQNDNDGIYTTESITGAMTLLDTEPIDGIDYKNGVFGYITLGVDPNALRTGKGVNPNPDVVIL